MNDHTNWPESKEMQKEELENSYKKEKFTGGGERMKATKSQYETAITKPFKDQILIALRLGLSYASETLRQYEMWAHIDPGVKKVYQDDIEKINNVIKKIKEQI